MSEKPEEVIISDQNKSQLDQLIDLKRAGADLPTIFSNRFNIFVGIEHTKIVLGENVHEGNGDPIPVNWHSSFIFPTNIILELSKMIPQLYGNARAERMQMIKAAHEEKMKKEEIPGESKPEEQGKPN